MMWIRLDFPVNWRWIDSRRLDRKRYIESPSWGNGSVGSVCLARMRFWVQSPGPQKTGMVVRYTPITPAFKKWRQKD